MYKNPFFSLVLFFSIFANLINTTYAEMSDDIAKASLVSEYEGIKADTNISLGLVLEPNPGWHVYWKYAGDYGSAPKFDVKFNNIKINPKIDWPTPEIIRGKNYVNYGYSKKTVYLIEFKPNNIKANNLIKVDFEWLACKVECIPGFKTLSLELPKVNKLKDSKFKTLIEDTRFSLPIPLSNFQIDYQLSNSKKIELFFPELEDDTKELSLIPETRKIIKNKAFQVFNPETKTLTIELKKDFDKEPYLKGLLVKDPPFETNREALEIEIGEKDKKLISKILNNEKKESLLYIILAAFIGGIILNFMPCVFPVIALKLLSLSKKSGKPFKYRLKHSLGFGLGIVVTFWSLVLLIKIAKNFGHQVGWGFQLQEPAFVIFLIFLLLLVALNLLGVYEIKLSLKGSTNTQKEISFLNSFSGGVLTTVLATPCTAPFMASAIAYGLSSSILTTFLIFTFLGIGLALPYTLLACLPQFQKFIPKPGNWMNYLRKVLAYPLFATVLWLLWVLEKQSTTGLIFITLGILLLLSMATWIYGILSEPYRSKSTRVLASLLFLATLLCSYSYNVSIIEKKKITVKTNDNLGSFSTDKYNQKWYVFSKKLLKKLEDENRSYYLDVTAAWCLTCQLNKSNVFGSEKIRTLFKDKEIILVKADWTNYNEKITELLQSYRKAGVPLNIYYNSKTKEKKTLPELLSETIILKIIK